MNGTLLLATWLTPLALAPLTLARRWLSAAAPLPALAAALVLLASQSESLLFSDLTGPLPAPAVPLLLLGFGVKLALPGLHRWLPGAYAMALAAVLSGPMISAGLLGWLRFLPLAVPGLVDWGTVLLWVGVAGVALGVLVGIVQHCPRRVLGYSSVAKMGVITAGFGVALGQPEHGVGIVTALGLFTLHHLLVKGTLFLGVGLWERAEARPWLFGGMTLLALALAGWALLLPALCLPFHPYQLPLDGDGWLPLLLGIAIFSAAIVYLQRWSPQVSLRLCLRARRALRGLRWSLRYRQPGPARCPSTPFHPILHVRRERPPWRTSSATSVIRAP